MTFAGREKFSQIEKQNRNPRARRIRPEKTRCPGSGILSRREFTKVFADRYGSQPSQHLEPMVIDQTNPRPLLPEEVKIIIPSDPK